MGELLTPKEINEIAEVVAEIWLSGKNDSQVFDFHECSTRQRWVARLAKSHKLDRPELRKKIKKFHRKSRQIITGYTKGYTKGGNNAIYKWERDVDIEENHLADQILATCEEEIRKQIRKEEINFLVDEATKVWSARIEEAKSEERERIVEILNRLGQGKAADDLFIHFHGEPETIGQALKEEKC